MTRSFTPQTTRQLVLALADSLWRGDDSPDARGFKDAGRFSRERTIGLVVDRATGQKEGER